MFVFGKYQIQSS